MEDDVFDQTQKYPLERQKQRYFACKFSRLMAKVCLANEIGPGGCWLLTIIVSTEDAKGYRGPVTYFNDQLIPLLGVSNVKSLIRIRNHAVESGWLTYLPGGKGFAGRYWVNVPDRFIGIDDAPTDERPSKYIVGTDDYPVSKTTGEGQGKGRESWMEATGEGQGKGRESGKHSTYTKDILPLPLPGEDQDNGVCDNPGNIKGPKPKEVIEHWNSHPGLLRCLADDCNRDRIIRQWSSNYELWIMHWKAAISFMGRTPFYCGGGNRGWRANLNWLIRQSRFVDIVEQMQAQKPMVPELTPEERLKKTAIEQFRNGTIDRAEAEKMYGGPLDVKPG